MKNQLATIFCVLALFAGHAVQTAVAQGLPGATVRPEGKGAASPERDPQREQIRSRMAERCKENPQQCEEIKAKMKQRQEQCKANPQQCEEMKEKIKQRREQCRADPEKCRAERKARREEYCKANPKQCEEMKAKMKQRREQCKADPEKCRAARDRRPERK